MTLPGIKVEADDFSVPIKALGDDTTTLCVRSVSRCSKTVRTMRLESVLLVCFLPKSARRVIEAFRHCFRKGEWTLE